MGRKSAKNVPISPWLSARADCKEGRFIQIGNSLLLSPRFQDLNAAAKFLYLCMTMEAGGKSTVRFPHSAAKKFGVAPSTFERGVKELINAEFITLEPDDDHAQFKANTYRFSNAWKSKPAPHFGEGQG